MPYVMVVPQTFRRPGDTSGGHELRQQPTVLRHTCCRPSRAVPHDRSCRLARLQLPFPDQDVDFPVQIAEAALADARALAADQDGGVSEVAPTLRRHLDAFRRPAIAPRSAAHHKRKNEQNGRARRS